MSSTSKAPERARRWWTEEEDQILKREVLGQLKEGSIHDWHLIASSLPNRSNKDCRKRWNKINSDVKKGAWDSAEDLRLRSAVARYGLSWTEVAKDVGTRHADQCAKRWQHALDPQVLHRDWDPNEDDRLLKVVETQGRVWSKLAEKEFPSRSATDIKNRHALLLRHQHSRRRRILKQLRDSTSESHNAAEANLQPSQIDEQSEDPNNVRNPASVAVSDANPYDHTAIAIPNAPIGTHTTIGTSISTDGLSAFAWSEFSAQAGSSASFLSPPSSSDAMNALLAAPVLGDPALQSSPTFPLDHPDPGPSMAPLLHSQASTAIPQPFPMLAAYATLTIQNAEARVLNEIMNILLREGVDYKIDLSY